MINTAISQLVQFALDHEMIDSEEQSYSVNLLLDLFGLNGYTPEDAPKASLYEILDTMLDYAVEHGLCEPDTTSRDLFDTRIMNTMMPRPAEVNRKFYTLYEEDPKKATDWYYDLSINSNYIRKSRTDKNIVFEKFYKYGPIQISINLSKPEKDPKEIAKAKLVKSSGYPKCLLCPENMGYAGHASHPARQTHRILPLHLKNGKYYLQYSPYVYYNEHCIVLNKEHIPMKIDRETFENLFSFVGEFEHYMAGSNTDIPIVGGSILTHDHYQGGRHHFPIEDAAAAETFEIDGVEARMLYWPLSTLRLRDADPEKLIDLSEKILHAWIGWSDEALDILNETDGERHNAITPIVRKKDGIYEIDLVLRNNRTSEQYPDGIFHPHPEHHHIKKENIGLIEVMGLAILPARLKDELQQIKEVLSGDKTVEEYPALEKHAAWIEEMKADLPVEDLDDYLNTQLTGKFVKVLENAGVYKCDEEGQAGFRRFIHSLQEEA